MTIELLDKFWHKTLKRPFSLNKTIDHGVGAPVILLHGIGRTGRVWKNVVDGLSPSDFRVVAFDLLGFGESPKPKWLDYNVDDHALAVISSIEKLKLDQQISLVGHSMGCLVALRVARLRPDLVRHLLLFEMPLHDGLPESRRYKVLNQMYYRFYNKITEFEPTFNKKNMQLFERFGRKVVGMEITADNWFALVRSLENTIMNQTAADDFKEVAIPIDVIYGTYDMMVIRGKPEKYFGDTNDNITTYKVRARHEISVKASRLIVERIRDGMLVTS